MEIQPLIITYYWPPSGGPGVQRWLKFVKYLKEFGISPTIVIPSNPSYPFRDETLIDEVPKEVTIIKIPIWEPHRIAEWIYPKSNKFKAGQFDLSTTKTSLLAKILIFIRGNIFIPDARVLWIPSVVRFLQHHMKQNHYTHVITTGPPHSLHLIGLAIKKNFPSVRWVADFRDPWTEISYHNSLLLLKFAQRLHQKLETKILSSADLVISTSYTQSDTYFSKGAHRVVTITNGFDDFPVTKVENSTEKFVITYAGVLEQLRNPSLVWKAIAELLMSAPSLKKQFLLRFIGKIDDSILKELDVLGLTEVIEQLGYLQHVKVIQKLMESHLLLLANFPNELGKGIIPGKLFDYLATGIPILSFGPEGGDVAYILQNCQAGSHFTNRSTIQEIQNYVLSIFERRYHTRSNRVNVEKYHRRKLTEHLLKVLKEL